MDKKRKITAKIPRKALIAMLLIGCLTLPIIGSIELVRFAGARPASDEGQILFSRNEGRVWSIWVMDADGKNEKLITSGSGARQPTWSPDGRQIAFSRYTDAIDDIYIMNADGSNMKRLTDSPTDNIFPAWSPDGKQIAFQGSIWLKSDIIYVVDADGSNVRNLGEDPAGSSKWPTWSPDGNKIAYECFDAAGISSIWVMDANGENRKMLHQWGQGPMDWSPNVDRIVFTSSEDSWKMGGNDVYIMDANGKNVKRLTQPGPSCYDSPVWSPDGTKIAFCYDRDGNWDNWDIYVMDVDGSNVQQLTNTPANEYWLDWTASSYAVKPAGKLKTTWGNIKHANYLESKAND